MIADVQQVKDRIDCRDLIARDLGKPKVRSSRYSSYPCPLHHETKGSSLVVYADGWHCHGKCQKSGDAISWLENYHGMDFKEAVAALGGNLADVPARPRVIDPPRHEPEPVEPPALEWQQVAAQVIARAHHVLFNEDAGAPGRHYLRQRGILKHTADFAGLGYIPGNPARPYRLDGLGSIYPGITIPWEIDNQTWGINVRRFGNEDGKGKYLMAQGSRRAGALYMADFLGYHYLPVLFVEGEFDALILWQVASDLAVPVTLGSAHARLHERWHERLITAPVILLATDSDEAGEKARDRLTGAFRARARIMKMPDGIKDVSDFYRDCGPTAVRDWLISAI